jgi:SHS2 domain-containing protein
MDQAAWQVLPPRKKGRRAEAQGIQSKESEPEDSLQARQAKIAENVALRAENSSTGKNADATLEGKDGCDSEFYEYLDHTADVQCHSWGPTLEAAFENMAPCMFNYMTDLALVKEDPDSEGVEIEVQGRDMKSLLFNYMDEMLFRFCTDQFCIKRVKVHSLIYQGNATTEDDITDNANNAAAAAAAEEERDLAAGGAGGGLDIKKGDFSILFTAYGATYDRSKHVQGTEVKAITYSNMQIHKKDDRSDLFVIVDI